MVGGMAKTSLSFRVRFAGLLLVVCGLASGLRAQTTEAEIKARLVGKPLYLRGFWANDKLKFDSTGSLTSKSPIGPFTLCGVEVSEVRVRPDELTIDARRIGLEFQNKIPVRVPLNTSTTKDQEDEKIHIQIAAPLTGDYTTTLNAIFVDGLPDVVPLLSAYWQPYMNASLSGIPPPVHVVTFPYWERPKAVIGGILPPKLSSQVEPVYTVEARRLKYTADITLFLTVGTDGSVKDISLMRAAGLGLDERALAAVSQYKFEPATENGTPVAVTVSIDVTFDIY